MSMLGSSGFAEFDRLGALFQRTRALLDAVLATGGLPDGGSEVLATETLPHIEDVEQGFRTGLRAAGTDVDELRHLLLQAGMVMGGPRDAAERRAALIEGMRALSGAGGDRELAPPPSRGLTALEHARLVLAMLPATPAGQVRYPGEPRTYADLSAPRGPAEFVQRVEELERVLWSVATGERPRPRDAVYRRVYGFFDAGELLSSSGLRFDHPLD